MLRQEVNKYSDTRKPQENRRHDPEHTRQDTCSKCGDFQHREGSDVWQVSTSVVFAKR